MLIFKTKGSVVIVAFLIVLLFAISECKRGGGGGRIFRTTILKGRRNSRRSRDLHAQQMVKQQWADPLSIPSKTSDETLDTHYSSLTNNPNDEEKSLRYASSFAFVGQKKDSQIPEERDAPVSQKRPLNWSSKLNFKSQERINKNPEDDDENIKQNTAEIHSSNSYIQSQFYNTLARFLIKNPIHSEYDTYSYYNNPKEIPKEITLLPETLLLCNQDFTHLCLPNTVPLCSHHGEILCVAHKQQTVSCGKDSYLNCVNTVVYTTEETENSHEVNKKGKIDASAKIPCLTNAIVKSETKAVSSSTSMKADEISFCVVTVLIPRVKEEPDKENADFAR